jgi:hypothetical protein
MLNFYLYNINIKTAHIVLVSDVENLRGSSA